MEKILLGKKNFWDEEGRKFKLTYWLLIRCTKQERIYGAAIEKNGAGEGCEREAFYGLSVRRNAVEAFLERLCAATALPTEFAALCDDFISEQEWAEQSERARAVS